MSDYQLQAKPTKSGHEGSWNLLLPLFVLVILSLTIGYVLQ